MNTQSEKQALKAENNSNMGYMIIRTTTARGAVPVPGATVTIKGSEKAESDIIFSLITNREGMTEKIALSAPPKSETEKDEGRPYSLYNIDVYADGYTSCSYIGVPIFEGITSYQTTDLTPLPHTGTHLRYRKPEVFEYRIPRL